MEDFSKLFTVEIYGPKGWEVVSTNVSWDAAAKEAVNWGGDYQIRLTSPRVERNELGEKIEKIHQEYKNGELSMSELSVKVQKTLADLF